MKKHLLKIAGILFLIGVFFALYSITHRPSRLLFYDRLERTVIELRLAGKTPRALREVWPLDPTRYEVFKGRTWEVEPIGRNLLVTQILRM